MMALGTATCKALIRGLSASLFLVMLCGLTPKFVRIPEHAQKKQPECEPAGGQAEAGASKTLCTVVTGVG